MYISEIDEAGVVPELLLKNRADKPLLIVDGEELVGAKQNRIINVTILIAGKTEVKIPVSCVEQGRWSYKTSHFEDGRRVFNSSGRASKMAGVTESVQRREGFSSNQETVWEEVEALSCNLGVVSPTGAVADAYTQVDVDLRDYLENFRIVENQLGMMVFINGKFAGLDTFGKHATLEEFFSKLLSSYAMDAVRTFRSGKKYRRPIQQAQSFLDKLKGAKIKISPSISLGHDVRLESNGTLGAALEHEKDVLHLCAFAKQGRETKDDRTGFASYRQRSRRFGR